MNDINLAIAFMHYMADPTPETAEAVAGFLLPGVTMSYSFQVRGTTKADANEKVAAALADVVVRQPEHAVDRAAAQVTAEVFIDMLDEDDSRDVLVPVNGSVGWYSPDQLVYTQRSIGVNAWMGTKVAEHGRVRAHAPCVAPG